VNGGERDEKAQGDASESEAQQGFVAVDLRSIVAVHGV